MNFFLIKCIKFFGILRIISCCLYGCLDYLNSKKLNDYISSIDKKSMFIGDSHIQNGINDELITDGINFSQNGESYYFSYQKLKKIIALNKQVKTIYLGFSYHNLSSYYDDYVFGKYNNEISSRYFFILPASEKEKFIKCNLSDEMLYFKKIFEKGTVNVLRKKNKYSFLGYYQNGFHNVESQKSSMDKRIQLQFFNETKIANFSEVNIIYLNKIIALCKENNKDLIVLNTPLDAYYKNNIPRQYIDRYNQIIETQKLRVIDFHNLKFQKNDFIKDGDHLSVKGSLLISNFLNN